MKVGYVSEVIYLIYRYLEDLVVKYSFFIDLRFLYSEEGRWSNGSSADSCSVGIGSIPILPVYTPAI